MKRVNIYIKEDEDKTIDHLSEILDSNRSEIIRRAVREFADNRQSELDDFLDGLVEVETPESENERISKEQVAFMTDCVDDPVFFAENAMLYPTIDRGIASIKLHDYQKEILSEINHRKRVILNTSRQCGGTLLELINVAYHIVFNSHKTVVLMSNKHANATDMLRKLKDMIETLPVFMQPKLIVKNKTTLELDNGCKVLATACTVDAVRGMTINYLLIDEAAFIKRAIFDEFMMSVMPRMYFSRSVFSHDGWHCVDVLDNMVHAHARIEYDGLKVSL